MARTKTRPAQRSTAPAQTGRPSLLDHIVTQRRDPTTGDTTPVTASQAIIDRLRTGAYREEAARSVGVAKQTFYNWLWRGARARAAQVNARPVHDADLPYIAFLDAVEEAEAAAMMTDWTRLGQLAAGGIERTTITEKVNSDGDVVERTTKVEKTLPDANVLMWRLERRWPERFGRKVEITGEIDMDVTDTRQRASQLVSEVQRFRQDVADGVIDVPSEEVSPKRTKR